MLAFEPEKWTLPGIARGFLVFGVLIAGSGLIWTAHTALFLSRSVKTQGVIVEVIATTSTRSPGERPGAIQSTNYYPVVEFWDTSGARHEVKSSRAARSDHYRRGDEVTVHYDPQDPEQAFIRDTWILWFSPGVILGAGLIWMTFVGVLLHFSKRFDARLAENKAQFFKQVIQSSSEQPQNKKKD
jgi:hypothetical protein